MAVEPEDALEVGEGVPRISLRQLTYFLATANAQSVLQAAQTLRVSSPSISTAIAHIEKLLQTQLFVRRHARGLVLTSAGRDFAAHARNILLQAREMELMGDRGRYQVRSRVNLGCLATLAPYLVPRLLTEVDQQVPHVELRWREGGHDVLLEGLHSGALDLIVTYDYDLPTTLHAIPLRPMPVQAVLPASHPLAAQPTCSLDDLVAEPMILLDLPKTRDYFLSIFSSKGLSPRVAHRTGSFEMARSLVSNGFGYTLLNFSPPYAVEGGEALTSRPVAQLDRSATLVLARLYRCKPPMFLEDLAGFIANAAALLRVAS